VDGVEPPRSRYHGRRYIPHVPLLFGQQHDIIERYYAKMRGD
jgi:hypothetical protein